MVHRPVADALASIVGSDSLVKSGATLTFYSLADVLQDVYTDTDWVTPASTAGVLTANSSGRFPKAYCKDTLDYKVVLKDSGGSTITTINPFYKAGGYLSTATASTTYVAKAGDAMTGPLNWKNGASTVASAATINLDNATSNYVHITGTTGITTITLAQGAMRWVIFDGALSLTHSSSLVLPYSLDITTVANDRCLLIGEGSGVTRMLAYWTYSGVPLIENAEILISASDETTNLTTGTAKVTFHMPFTMYLTSSSLPRGSLSTAQAAGSLLAFDVNKNGVSIFSTTPTFDNNEKVTTTAATPCVLASSPTTLTVDDEITVDIDTVGTALAKGLKVLLRGYRKNR